MADQAAPRRGIAPTEPRTLRERLAERREQRSVERLYREHHQEIYRYCLAIVRKPADAEDAMQATMAAALRSLPGEERSIAMRPWLFRVAHNESISIIRARRETPTESEQLERGSESVDEEFEGKERLRTLVADLQSLPERQRSALVMRELSGLPYPEIAAALGSGEGAARQIVHEARSALATRTEGRRMECEEARAAIDGGDRRRLRGRKVQAHLAACQACSDFKLGIEARSNDLQAICPPLPLAAAGGIFAAIAGGGGGSTAAAAAGGGATATGLGATTVAGGVGSAAAVKSASLVAAAVIAAGAAADVSGVVELPGPLHIGGQQASDVSPGNGGTSGSGASAEGTGAAGKPGSAQGQDARSQGEAASTKKGANGKGHGKQASKGKGNGKSGGKGNSGNNGNQGSAGGNPSAPGGGKDGAPSQAGGNPQPGPPASSPAAPGAGSGSSGGSQGTPPANSNAGGNSGAQAPPTTPPAKGGGKPE